MRLSVAAAATERQPRVLWLAVISPTEGLGSSTTVLAIVDWRSKGLRRERRPRTSGALTSSK